MRQAAKRVSGLGCWDLDKGSRKYINQDSRANRKLKKKLRRADRKKLSRYLDKLNEVC